MTLKSLQEELADSPAVAIVKNREGFERKFTIMERNITVEMRRIVGHEGDRVIGAVLTGPHERIVDPVCTRSCIRYTIEVLMSET